MEKTVRKLEWETLAVNDHIDSIFEVLEKTLTSEGCLPLGLNACLRPLFSNTIFFEITLHIKVKAKTFTIFFFRTRSSMILKLDMYYQGLKVYKVNIMTLV